MTEPVRIDRPLKLERVEPANPAALLALDDVWWDPDPFHPQPAFERWLTTVWPANLEACFRVFTRRLWIQRHERESAGLDEIPALLLDRRQPAGPQAVLAVAMAYGAIDPALRGLAAEVTLALIANRRIDGPTLGRALAFVLHEQRDVEAGGPGHHMLVTAVPERWIGAVPPPPRSSRSRTAASRWLTPADVSVARVAREGNGPAGRDAGGPVVLHEEAG